MTCPGNLDVIAGGAGGMGPYPPSQLLPPGVEYAHNILQIYYVYSLHIPCIYLVYTMYIYYIFHVYT